MNDSLLDSNPQLNIALEAEVEDMMKAGVHLGHSKSKNHPSMIPFIHSVRNGTSIIDLSKTSQYLKSSLDFLKETAQKGGFVIFVGTRPGASSLVQEIGSKFKMPYVKNRWIGGTFTNFKEIGKRIAYMEKLESEKASGDFEKYTKKERMQKEKEIERMKIIFEGLRTMKKLPDALVVVDTVHDIMAVKEANSVGIPVVALADTNTDLRNVTWPIPANDSAISSIQYILKKIEIALENGISEKKVEIKEKE